MTGTRQRRLQWRQCTLRRCTCITLCICLSLTAFVLNVNFSEKVFHQRETVLKNSHVQPSMNRKQCKEKTKIVFLKVHKTESTTVSNILQRFGHERKLNFALPNKSIGDLRFNYFGGIGDTLKKEFIIPLSKDHSYDILCHHVVFSDLAFDEILPNNVTYVTLLRDPTQQFVSALLYYKYNENLTNIANTNITDYLINPLKYEDKNPYYSFTNNRQSLDLGLTPNGLHDEETIDEYIYVLDGRFDLVMISEYFDESLVILKRLMCWDLKDVLYMRKNPRYRTFDNEFSSHDLMLLKNWQKADYLIYRHFLKKLFVRIKQEKNLAEEVNRFREILHKMEEFCDGRESNHVVIESSVWNAEFSISSIDCAFMRLSEISFITKLRYAARS